MDTNKNIFCCPICKQSISRHVNSSDKSFFPFCSKRCQTIDLGAWAKEEYRVATDKKPELCDIEDDDLEEQ